jgi:DNA-binding PadR family transcriptional regulator
MGEHDRLRESLPWPLVRKYLERRLEEFTQMVDDAETTEQLWEARGSRRAIKSLLNMPEAIIMEKEAEDAP